MSWIIAGTAAGSAVLGAAQASQQRKAAAQTNAANANLAAAQTRFSPWTGMAGKYEAQPLGNTPLAGAAQGGLAGAIQGQGIKNSMAANDLIQAKIAALNQGGSQYPNLGLER